MFYLGHPFWLSSIRHEQCSPVLKQKGSIKHLLCFVIMVVFHDKQWQFELSTGAHDFFWEFLSSESIGDKRASFFGQWTAICFPVFVGIIEEFINKSVLKVRRSSCNKVGDCWIRIIALSNTMKNGFWLILNVVKRVVEGCSEDFNYQGLENQARIRGFHVTLKWTRSRQKIKEAKPKNGLINLASISITGCHFSAFTLLNINRSSNYLWMLTLSQQKGLCFLRVSQYIFAHTHHPSLHEHIPQDKDPLALHSGLLGACKEIVFQWV